MIPSPNLDDRRYQDIVNEAIRLIPRYCPEWTNHNPTDPGMTLVELFAWMTEMTIYRLNKVPEKTYMALLDLLGMAMVPPQPSKVLLRFIPVDGLDRSITVPKGLQVSAGGMNEAEAVIFETERALSVFPIQLESCVSTHQSLVTDNLELLKGKNQGFYLFGGDSQIERSIYCYHR